MHALLILVFAPFALANLVDDVLDGLKNAVTCGACHTLVATMKGIAELGDEPFTDVVTAVCKATKVLRVLSIVVHPWRLTRTSGRGR